ncbi:MAG: PQQ-binding-like beta-propeller repeat protein [Planctomycetota bacterium]
MTSQSHIPRLKASARWPRPRLSVARLIPWCLLAGGIAGASFAQPLEQVDQLELIGLEQAVVDGPGRPVVGFSERAKGIRFHQVQEDTAEQLAGMLALLESGAWEKAFKQYNELRSQTEGRLTPVGGEGLYLPVRQLIAERVETMPAPGREAFRLYFDAYAAQLLAAVENHPQPGSYEQFRLAQELFDWFALTDSGPRAGELLADLCYERGRFARAAACWERVLKLHPNRRSEAAIQSRRFTALLRAGNLNEAKKLQDGLRQRYGGDNEPILQLGGERLALTRYLQQQMDQHQRGGDRAPANNNPPSHMPLALPERGSEPRWVCDIVTASLSKLVQNNSDRRNWNSIDAMIRFIPPVACDERCVYGLWMGSVFAVDLQTGKILWNTVNFSDAVLSINDRKRFYSDINAYRIALSSQCVLVVDAAPIDGGGAFTLTAYDKTTGAMRWDSAATLYDRTVCGEPLVHDNRVYLTTRPRNSASGELRLHCVDPNTGEADWSASLGDVDKLASPYSIISGSIQPVLHATDQEILVLTNHGGLVAVDRSAGEVTWAFELIAPAHLEADEPLVRARVPDRDSLSDASPGGLIQVGSTIYLKESMSRKAYAIDVDTLSLVWSRPIQSLYAELDGIIDDRLILIANNVELLGLDGESRRTLSTNNIGKPGSNALVGRDALYLLTNGRIVQVATQHPYATQVFREDDMYSNEGGRLIAAEGLLICVSRSGLVAYPAKTQAVNPVEKITP